MALSDVTLLMLYCVELLTRQKKGLIGSDVILLTVEDPKAKVGSGGATINALLVLVEHISARQGYTVRKFVDSSLKLLIEVTISMLTVVN